jgi:hypothetical protein
MKATAAALNAVAEFGGPVCCKRESITTIKTYMKMNDEFGAPDDEAYICRYHQFNKGCLMEDCPYFPALAER